MASPSLPPSAPRSEPGPGTYEAKGDVALGPQVLSQRHTSPMSRFPKGNRWSNFSKARKGPSSCPSPSAC